MTCKCLTPKDALRLAFAGRELPHCEEHDLDPIESGSPLALNDDDGLTNRISNALGVPVNTTTNL
jgi:hypothetical protein